MNEGELRIQNKPEQDLTYPTHDFTPEGWEEIKKSIAAGGEKWLGLGGSLRKGIVESTGMVESRFLYGELQRTVGENSAELFLESNANIQPQHFGEKGKLVTAKRMIEKVLEDLRDEQRKAIEQRQSSVKELAAEMVRLLQSLSIFYGDQEWLISLSRVLFSGEFEEGMLPDNVSKYIEKLSNEDRVKILKILQRIKYLYSPCVGLKDRDDQCQKFFNGVGYGWFGGGKCYRVDKKTGRMMSEERIY